MGNPEGSPAILAGPGNSRVRGGVYADNLTWDVQRSQFFVQDSTGQSRTKLACGPLACTSLEKLEVLPDLPKLGCNGRGGNVTVVTHSQKLFQEDYIKLKEKGIFLAHFNSILGSCGICADSLQSVLTIEDSTECIRYLRPGEQPPAHYRLDVDSFSRLTSSLPPNSRFIESTEFIVGGYRWVIQIYPDGDEKKDGQGYISIYLKLCNDPNPVGSSIIVVFRALVLDQKRTRYLVIQAKEKRFDAANEIWGISRALPQAVFTSQSNGFLMLDQCTFGVEVFITKTSTPAHAEVSYIDSNNTRTHTWQVKFSELSDDEYSPEFTIERRIWKLNVCPRGCGDKKGQCLSLYLHLTQANDLIAGNKLYIEFELRIRNQLGGRHHSRIIKFPFEKSSKCCGRTGFVPITDLNIEDKGLLVKDMMYFEVIFRKMLIMRNI